MKTVLTKNLRIALLLFVVLIATIITGKGIALVIAQNTSDTSVTINNTPPDFTVSPYESPASFSGTAINVGSSISFNATGTDPNSDQYYLAICKTNAITAGTNAAPTCTGGNWCISGAVNSASAASCSYTALQTDSEGPNVWYAFVCDKITATGGCSASSQGVGNSGSPFFVNRRPTFSAIVDDGGTGPDSGADPGGIIAYTATASDSDSDFAQDNVQLVVCADTAGASAAGCIGTTICVSSLSLSAPTCNSPTLASVLENGNYNYYAYVFDNHGLAAATNYISGQYTINNKPPSVTNVKLNNNNVINLSVNTTAAILVTGTVTDLNSCQDIASVKDSVYRTTTYNFSSCDDAITESNPNFCYAMLTCTVVGGTCTGNTDASADYTCTVNMQFHADPTKVDGDATDPSWAGDKWKATLIAYDSVTSGNAESTVSVDVNKLAGINLVTTAINYGAMSAGTDSGTVLNSDVNKNTVVESAGNVGINLDISGTDMCTSFTPPSTCSGATIALANQKYAYNVTQFTWSSQGTILTGSPVLELVLIPKTTVTALKANKKILWGINIPMTVTAGTYNGQNTLSAVTSGSSNW
ncbi:MAG: hypothetical protein WCJ58_07935 [bacterium]